MTLIYLGRRSPGRRRTSTAAPSAPELSRHAHHHAAVLAAQRHHGNGHVARVLAARKAPEASTMTQIEGQSRQLRLDDRYNLAFAGTAQKKDPPGGMQFIAAQSHEVQLGGKPAGFTAVKSAAAFTAPSFSTTMAAEKDGYKRRYFAVVDSTSTADVTHDSFYPGPGTHDNATSKQPDGTYTYFWTISSKISELIRKGEQEHLDDAKRAYDLTYGLIAKEINALAGKKFGPTDTPKAAEELAEAELARKLPAQLGTDPLKWFQVLEEMLTMTLKRDRGHLHDLTPGEAVQKGKTFYIPLQTTPQTKIDQVGSDQIVTYPGATGSPAASGDAHGHAPEDHASE